jgi:hypothetical protein
MAKIPDGILGALIGKIGPVSGYRRNGENILRTAHSRGIIKATPARTAQREKIKVCNEFTKAFAGTGFFNRTFPAHGSSGTGYNRATSAIMNLAISGNLPYTTLNYSEVLISKGILPPAASAVASATTEGNIYFKWNDNSENGTAKPNDKAIFVAYFTGIRQVIFSIGDATRRQGHAFLRCEHMKGLTAETWIGFLSNDEKNASNSLHTGRLNL